MYWLIAATILLLGDRSLLEVQASCKTGSGLAMCCRGRQPSCCSYTYDNGGNYSSRYQYCRYSPGTVFSLRSDLRTCFCDEHCTLTNDCCPDYRELCHKPAIDCTVSNWGPWSECNHQCGAGVRIRRRRVTHPAVNGGRHCPVLEETTPCQGTKCISRRVGRSGTLMIPFMNQVRSEVAHLLPMRKDVLRLTRRWDMRFDERRKLYLGRLIQQNKTEEPEPDPYCAVYEITHTNPACQMHNILWHYNRPSRLYDQKPNEYAWGRRNQGWLSRNSHSHGRSPEDIYTFNRNPYMSAAYRRVRRSARSSRFGNDEAAELGTSEDWRQAWTTHSALLQQGQHICVTCYPSYMREELGFRCSGTGLLNIETRWRALRTADCHGKFRMLSIPQRACTCGRGTGSFIFV
ncbi:hypothetical protein CRM22_001376 [Opisthorchis felineus]|uniref:SMB domain-containing protein n=1 Tax=Opisthorchis felineus TaxID=147828 RepID=A0A4S2MGU4_OPIFE|nr:hypothetical protein CRM22_001376 [Opisthorchis felineus]